MLPPVLRHVPDPRTDCVGRRTDRHRRSGDDDLAGIGRRQAEQCLSELGPPGSDKAGDAEDFSLADRQ